MGKKTEDPHKQETLEETQRFLGVVHDLRTKCPWDNKQTHESLTPYLLEETYEAINAIESRDMAAFKEELGDILLQIALHAEIASEQKGGFDFEEVAKTVADKMIHRHPHVYDQLKVKDADEVLRNWVEIKKREKPERTPLEGIPKNLPALQLAQKYGQRAATVGFDWPSIEGVFAKVQEEINELSEESEKNHGDKEALEMELGDVLFTVTNLARHLKIDAERALRKSSGKFEKRFERLMRQLEKENKSLRSLSLDEMEAIWSKVK